MEIAEWIVWGLACGWTVLIFFDFLMCFFGPDKPAAFYLSVNQRRVIGGLHVMSLLVALVATTLWGISKLHLLWFVPAFAYFIVKRAAVWFFMWRQRKQCLSKGIEEICEEMQKDGWDISKDTFKKDISIRPVRREFFKRIEADTNKMLEQMKTRVQNNENESQKHSK